MSDCSKYNNGFDLQLLQGIGAFNVEAASSNGAMAVGAFKADGAAPICLPEIEEMLIPWYVFGSDVVEINNNHFGVVYFK